VAQFSVAVIQAKSRLGDVAANTQTILDEALRLTAANSQLELMIFPEQALLGMPAYDLLLRKDLEQRVEHALARLAAELPVPIVLGFPRWVKGECFNALGVIFPQQGLLAEHHQLAFEDLQQDQGLLRQTYFSAGNQATTFTVNGHRFGLALGSDIFRESLLAEYQALGVEWLLHCANGPYSLGQEEEAVNASSQVVNRYPFGVVHCNMAGGQDGIIFQGGSHIVAAQGKTLYQAPLFETHQLVCDLMVQQTAAIFAWPQEEAALYGALVRALADYVAANGFKGALLGLSGGIDSALTLVIAADALGAENVCAVMMPFDYTSAMSKEDAAQQAKILGVDYKEIPIRAPFNGFMGLLADELADGNLGTTEENLQARCRGVILMALSNKNGQVVLACSNKSECAVGYSTLYGDMVGGYSLLKDVPKTWVYRLARWRNAQQDAPVIPWRVIERPPTAELAPGQLDENSLPDYDVLDEVVERYVVQQQDMATIVAAGLPEEEVRLVISLIDRNEYKRQQGALGPKVTGRAFGVNRRYPVSYRW